MNTTPSPLAQRLAASATFAMVQKAAELRAAGIDVISMSVGEPDFATPDYIKEAAHKAIDENYSKYSPVTGYMWLREAVCKKLKNENNLDAIDIRNEIEKEQQRHVVADGISQ